MPNFQYSPPPFMDAKQFEGLESVPKKFCIARLLNEDQSNDSTEATYTFLCNPEQLQYTREAVYNPANTYGSTVQSQQYFHTKGRELNLSNVLLEGWSYGKVVDDRIKQLEKLMMPDTERKSSNPRVLKFAWGSEGSFGPCVLTKLTVVESMWRDGRASRARLNITLLEVPLSDKNPTYQGAVAPNKLVQAYNTNKPVYTAAAGSNSTSTTTSNSTSTSNSPLTDRQMFDAEAAAHNYLKANTSKFQPTYAQQVNLGKYRILIDKSTGKVIYLPTTTTSGIVVDNPNAKSQEIGTYDAKTSKFTPNNTALFYKKAK